MATSKKIPVGGGATEWVNHPEGQYPVSCIDVIDVGYVETKFGWKPKTRFVFWGGEWTTKIIEGEEVKLPLTVMATFNTSLHENSTMRPFLESWRGKPFNEGVEDSFDVENVYQAPAFVNIQHRQVGDKTYANITSIMPLPKGMEAPGIPDGYVRVEDREDWPGPKPHPDMSSAGQTAAAASDDWKAPDDDLPF